MNHDLIARAVRATAPIDDGALATLDFERADLDLLDAILDGSFVGSGIVGPDGAVGSHDTTSADDAPGAAVVDIARRRSRTRRFLLPAAVAACIALIVGIVISVVDDRTNYADAAVLVAQANERLLIDAPGWKVTAVNQFTEDNGEMVFGNGSDQVSLNWYPASLYDSYLADRQLDGDAESTALLGQAAMLVQHTDADSFYLLLAPNEVNFLEIRGDGLGGRDAFLDLVARFRQVSVDEWLGALPSTTVTADERDETVGAMLADIDLPPGFDTSALETPVGVSDPYQLGAAVVSSVVCAWFDVYFDAQEGGDTATAAEAATALGGSHDWKVLQDMSATGAFPRVVFDTVDPIQPGGTGVMSSGNRVTREVVAGGFGCAW